MVTDASITYQHVLWSGSGDLGLRLDPVTGLPQALLLHQGDQEVALPLAFSATLVVDGEEQPGVPYGLVYVNTTTITDCRLRDQHPQHQNGGPEDIYTVRTALGPWHIEWEYRFRQQHPRLELNLSIGPAEHTEPATLRNLHLSVDLALPDLSAWRVEAPGNCIRPGVAADTLATPIPIAPAGGVMGSTGLIAVHHPEQRQTLTLWPFSRTEIGEIGLQTIDNMLRCTISTGLAGRMATPVMLRYGSLQIDAFFDTWEAVRHQVPTWYQSLGLSTPHDRPSWIETASIFEVQIGTSVFNEGYCYAPYPTVRDVLADLGRIKGLGYDVLQIMPRQPYPSYNVHDYADITTSYGDEADLRELVRACHAQGMRVILDILLHGVIDQEVMMQTAERVRSGPFFSRLTETGDTFHGNAKTVRDVYHIAWCRHILDFEPHWSAYSPPRHPLVEQHPEWFMRDSAQRIIGIYTKAFDVANVTWQDYFIAAAEELVRRLDIDGFRFDAPTYNALPNWSEATAERASYSPLGCLQLFERLRARLKRLKPSAILYTEPSGVLFRQTMDITYNYDEQWLISAVLPPEMGGQDLTVRHGRDLAAWFRDRNAVLPPGSLITHHIDSHDTFWWPLPGRKWRREQYGIAASRALLAVFALSGGAYMTFVGGEEGLEEEIRHVHHLRTRLPALGHGAANYTATVVDHHAIYAVLRQSEDMDALVLVNMTDQPLTTRCTIDRQQLTNATPLYTLYDVWNQEGLHVEQQYVFTPEALEQLPLRFEAYQPRVILVRPYWPY